MSWVEDAKATALLVKAGQWTSYHIDQLADHVLHFCSEREGVAPEAPTVAPVEPVAPEVHVEGADVPPSA